MKHTLIMLALICASGIAAATPGNNGGGNGGCGVGQQTNGCGGSGTTSGTTNNGGDGLGVGVGVGIGVGLGGAGGRGGDATAIGNGGSASSVANGGAGGSVSGSGNSNNANSNTNTANGYGGASSSQSGATSTSSNQGNNSAQNVTVNGDTYQAPRIPVATAYAPQIAPTAVCMGSTSGGVQGLSFGVSIGSSWTDSNCMLLEQVRSVAAVLGDKETAAEMMCGVAAYAEARARAGKPCSAK